MARAKRKLPAKPAAFISPQHRSHFCRRHPIPEHKAPAADNTHPTKTSRLGQTAPTDTRTQKKPAAAPNTAGRFHFSAPPRSLLPRHPIPEHKAPAADNTHPTKTSRLGQTAPTDTRTQKNPLPLRTPPAAFFSLKKPQRCLNAIVQRQPPPAGAQHHLTQPNPNISGRRFTAFFALRCL